MNNNEPDKPAENPVPKKPIQIKAEDDLLDITRDPVFKAVLIRDSPGSRNALRCLVSAAIDQPVTVLSVTANEPPVNNLRDREIRYDIAVKFNDGSLGDIEMTLYPDTHEHLRQEYYLARLFTTQDIKGIEHHYKDLQPAWQISILGKNIHNDQALVHRFRYYDQENNLSFNGLTAIINIELKKAEQFLDKPIPAMTPIERWSVFFQYALDPERLDLINEILNYDEGVAMATAELLTVSEDERERARIEHELKNQLDWQSGMTNARLEGEDTGYKLAKMEYDGIIQTLKAEREQAEQEREQAKQERQQAEQKRRESVQNLRGLGLGDGQITQALGLSPEEVSEYL
ncbi:hypothetical protein TREPR_3299 [Treponema primitia ZAS-2]|uniref:Rpn family recombination-promoting nuclease/putative transposase n=1 Tax=Treponema primitia (strain ATCC BAA-887 / DSM 12427 / ZAS-2) TaxID=545694 RepID=F5YKB6_TREPZ|nr:PD-(D/E)XK nuclease family transposase [Treponema primitia]AEF86477.1 hypothetical protein TREPR_3299 [Treponema primitia ZAS-2]